MENRNFYYARVSTAHQHEDKQIDAFYKLGATDRDIIVDKESGKNLDRPGYQALKTTILRPGDCLYIQSLDRLSRSKTDIRNELQFFKENNIKVKILDLPTTMMDFPKGQEWVFDMVNNILIEVYSSIASRELQNIHQRQAEGIAAAKARGKYLGRPRLVVPDNWNAVYKKWIKGEITGVEAMKETGLKRGSFYKLVNKEKEGEK